MAKPDYMCVQMLPPEGTVTEEASLGDGQGRGLVSRDNLWSPGQTISLRFLNFFQAPSRLILLSLSFGLIPQLANLE